MGLDQRTGAVLYMYFFPVCFLFFQYKTGIKGRLGGWDIWGMNKTKIEWCDYSWNPIKGLCPVGCWYCYGRKIYQRFHLNPEVRLDLDELMGPCPKKPSRIFVCSTFEIFHPLADPYRDNVFKQIALTPEHTFIVLTKMPDRVNRAMPPNVWLGVSVTDATETWRINRLLELSAGKRFVSYEPMLGRIYHLPKGLDWIIIGQLTGAKKRPPEKDWVERLVGYAKEQGVPVFLKNNLAETLGKPMIQEFPK
jgi:protein gp37